MYYFVNKKFESLKSKNIFIETAKNFNNYYGSPFVNIQESEKEKNLYTIRYRLERR